MLLARPFTMTRPPDNTHTALACGGGVAAAIVCFLLSGCSGTDFPEVRVPAEQQHVLAASAPAAAPLSIPEDRPFAIHIKQSSQNPGPEGEAKADSDATPAGTAFCHADVSKGGSATANFTLGQRVDNRASGRQAVIIEVEYDLGQDLVISQPPAKESTASCGLTLAVLDSRKKVIARIPLLTSTSDTAAGQATTHDQRRLSVLFDPRQSYDILIYGKVEAATAVDQTARARLDLSKVRMRLTFTPVASAPAP